MKAMVSSSFKLFAAWVSCCARRQVCEGLVEKASVERAIGGLECGCGWRDKCDVRLRGGGLGDVETSKPFCSPYNPVLGLGVHGFGFRRSSLFHRPQDARATGGFCDGDAAVVD